MNDSTYYRAVTKNDIDLKVMGVKIPKGTEFLVLIDNFDPEKKLDGCFPCKKLGITSILHDEFKLIDNIPMSCSLCRKKYTSYCPCFNSFNEDNVCESFNPYPPRMTAEEFNIKEAEILKDLPEEFRSTISSMAYERGHSAGYEECLIHVREYVNNLKEPIENYRKRIS